MVADKEHKRNEAAYHRLKESISQSYPHGWFVGIADEHVVGAAATFDELECQLRAKGFDPRDVFVAEAGVNYPEFLTIYL